MKGRVSPLCGRRDSLVVVLIVGVIMTSLAFMNAPEIGIDQFRLPKELGALLTAAGVASLATFRRTLRADLPTVVMVLCVGWAVVSIAFVAENKWAGWRLLSVYWSATLIYWAVTQRALDRRESMLLLSAVVAVGVAASVATLLEYSGLWSGRSLLYRAPSGVFGNRNHAAHFIAVTLPATLALLGISGSEGLPRARSWRWVVTRGAVYASVSACAAALVVTRARAAWLAMALAVAVLVGVMLLPRLAAAASVVHSKASDQRHGWRRHAGGWCLAMSTGLLLGALLPTPLEWSSERPLAETAANLTNYRTGSGQGRLIQYAATLRMAAAHPVMGVGLGNWTIHYLRYAAPNDPSVDWDTEALAPTDRLPLSDWVGILAEAGFTAGVMLFGIAFVFAATGWRLLSTRRSEADQASGVALLMLLAIIGVLGTLDAVVQNAAPSAIAAVLLATLARRAVPGRSFRLGRPVRVVLLLIVATPSLCLVYLTFRHIRSVAQYGTFTDAPALQRAVAIDPTDYTAQALLAHHYVTTGNCKAASSYIRAARALRPGTPFVERLQTRCDQTGLAK